jgi:hypothetical protein
MGGGGGACVIEIARRDTGAHAPGRAHPARVTLYNVMTIDFIG